MDFIKGWFKKKEPFLTPAEILELTNLKKEAYMEEAKKIVKETGKKKAQAELMPKAKKEDF